MPTYICRVARARLDAGTRAALAATITRIHTEVTGAQGFFAQVLFEAIEPGTCFLAGEPADEDHCFIHGQIRAGRSALSRAQLIDRIVEAAASALRMPRHAIWVYISELPPRAMAEYGSVLPEPGDEALWLAGLPDDTRRKLNKP